MPGDVASSAIAVTALLETLVVGMNLLMLFNSGQITAEELDRRWRMSADNYNARSDAWRASEAPTDPTPPTQPE